MRSEETPMTRSNSPKTALVLMILAAGLAPASPPDVTPEAAAVGDYRSAIHRTVGMVGDPVARNLAAKHGLQILNVTWEDTGRYKGSAVGPNISDMTIQVAEPGPARKGQRLHLMPVIRHPNFSDRAADLSPDDFYLLIGNEKGRALEPITLTDFLADIRRYLSDGDSWKGWRRSLLAPRDSHVLVSAQACFLPIPADGEATFNPVLFNYQSYGGDPAVLTILATREGTSVTVIDNKRDGFAAGWSWGQRLFFNQAGERASLTGRRESEHVEEDARAGGGAGPGAAQQSGLNMVLLIQVPLKQKRPMMQMEEFALDALGYTAAPGASMRGVSDVENAVIGHGEIEGPFTEIDDLPIERDPNLPIRVTVQFYKATSNGIVDERDLDSIATQLERVYDEADFVGSLVVDGETWRPTEYDGPKEEPEGWWSRFWRRHFGNMRR
jgi:hypothetical protein